jgi:hypothetical protein
MQQRSLASAWMVRPGSQERVEGAAQAWALQGLGLGQVWVCTEGSEGQCLGKPTFMASTLVRGHSGHGASASADGQATRSSLRVGHVHLAARAAAAPRTPQFRAFLSPGWPKDAQKVLESLWAAQTFESLWAAQEGGTCLSLLAYLQSLQGLRAAGSTASTPEPGLSWGSARYGGQNPADPLSAAG